MPERKSQSTEKGPPQPIVFHLTQEVTPESCQFSVTPTNDKLIAVPQRNIHLGELGMYSPQTTSWRDTLLLLTSTTTDEKVPRKMIMKRMPTKEEAYRIYISRLGHEPSPEEMAWTLRNYQTELANQADVSKKLQPGTMSPKTYGFAINDENGDVSLLREYVPGITLEDIVLQFSENKNPHQFYRMIGTTALQVIDQLQEMHTKGIVHRDIVPSNIIISDDGTVHIIDLGYARDNNTSEETYPKHVGTVGFTPLEQYPHGEQYGQPDTFAVDTYSLAVTLYCMIHGSLRPPEFLEGNPYPWTPERISQFRQNYASLADVVNTIIQAFSINPTHRPSLAELQKSIVTSFSPYFHEDDVVNLYGALKNTLKDVSIIIPKE